MSVLRKKGKPKLRFRNMSNRVINIEFKYVKKLILECLKENVDIEKQLDSYYRHIQIFLFYEHSDKNVAESIRTFFDNPTMDVPSCPVPAFAVSEKGLGCIVFFLKHFKEFTEKRDDIVNVKAYHKNGIFEELCHLVEQKGDSSIHSESYWKLWNSYRSANKLSVGNEIIANLDTNRNHYEVYLMIIKTYPNQWIERCWKFFICKSPDYNKMKAFPKEIVQARIVVDGLKDIGFQYVINHVPRDRLSDKHKKLLHTLIETTKKKIDEQKKIMETELGLGAFTLIDSLPEDVFKTSKIFFSVVLDLWKSLRLV